MDNAIPIHSPSNPSAPLSIRSPIRRMAYFVNWAGMDPSLIPAASLTHVFYAFASIDASTYQRMAYFVKWAGMDPSVVPAATLTHVFYAFASIDVVPSNPAVDVTEGLYLRFNSALKDTNPAIKTLLSIGGYSAGTTAFVNAASSPSSRSAFIQSAIILARSYNFDGLDLDWEFPTGNAALFSALVTDFRAAIESEAASSGNPMLLLSAAVSAYEPTIAESYDVPTLNSALDFVNVMTYDLHGSWELITGMHTALEDLSNPQLSLKGAMAAWVSRGLAPSKAMLGLAMYGRTWTLASTSSTGVGAAATGPGQPGSISQEAGVLFYREIDELVTSGGYTATLDAPTSSMWYDEWKGEREYDKDDDDDYHQWLVDRQPKQPDTPAEFSPPQPPSPGHVVDLKGRRLQVVVKVASIQLTPDSPKYPGGTWHVEGMRNEHIVATGIYYFNSHNITEPRLQFRITIPEPDYDQNDNKACDNTSISSPPLPFFPSPSLPHLSVPQATGIYYFDSHNITELRLQFRITVAEPDYDQNDNKGVARIYGLVDDGPLTQPLGSVRTDIPNLCLAFPNHFHHRVAPFELQDKTRAGHRKILVFFLVDPRVAIVSTARVPPQQLSWQRRELERKGHPCSVLPGLALDLIAEGVSGGEHGEEGKGERSGVERGGEEGRVDEGEDGGEGQGVGRESRDGRGAAMTMEEAKKYREALMEERKALVQLANEELFERPFSLCEH
ncbi:unnamed protein product [Closterium sp. NIES-65]|nr:unnamed protein product [Closterium sp. NIES-65]